MAAVQILIINIIMDSLNSLSFGGEPPKEEYMKEKPLRKGSGLFINGAMARILDTTVDFLLIFGIIIFFKNLYPTEIESMTARFAALCIAAVFNGFSIRTDSINLFKGIRENKSFVYIAIGIIVATLLLCNITGNFVQTTALNLKQWIFVFALPSCMIGGELLARLIYSIKNKK